MINVTVKNNMIKVGSKELPLLSGEVHYWRHNPETWGHIIDRVKELGLNTVCTYVPWQYHEYERGKYDFDGITNPQRNLVAYLELLRSKDMWLIIRPGPYLYTEWVNKGVPDYVVKYHRNHKEFKRLSEIYIRRVCDVIRPYLATNGGNIIMLQADNEVDVWSRYYENDMGFLEKSGEFQSFLKGRYRSISALNKAWGTKYKSFDAAKPVTLNIIDDPLFRRRFFDFCEFRLWFSVEVNKWAGEAFRKNGIDVPISMNAYPFHDVQSWREIQKHCDVFGIDSYPVREFGASPYEQRVLMDRMRYTRTFARTQYLGEFQIGTWQGAQEYTKLLTPNHYRLTNITALQSGMTGWNWYMLANRDNWYQSPINEWGRKRTEVFPVFQDLVKWYKDVRPYECERLTDVGTTFHLLQECAWLNPQDNAALQSMFEADIDYDFFDTETGKLAKKVVFYSSRQFLPAQAQKNLLEYVKKGGALVVFQDYPRYDDCGKPLNLLKIKDPDKILEQHHLKIKLGKREAPALSHSFVYNSTPGEKIFAKTTKTDDPSMEEETAFERLAEGTEYVIGYIEKRGKGKLIVVGVRPNPVLIEAITSWLGIDIYAKSLAQGVTTSLLKRKDGKYFIIATNNTNEQKYCTIQLSKKLFGSKTLKARDIVTGNIFKFSAGRGLSIPVNRKDGAIIEINR